MSEKLNPCCICGMADDEVAIERSNEADGTECYRVTCSGGHAIPWGKDRQRAIDCWNGQYRPCDFAMPAPVTPKKPNAIGDWISVEERLPEADCCDCLVVDESGTVTLGWLHNNGWHQYGVTKPVNFTHWMPLPEPPRGDK